MKAEIEQEVVLDPQQAVVDLPLPEALRNRNLAIEVSGAGERQMLSSFANVLDVRLAPRDGQVQVLHAGDGKPLSAVYVKVYAEEASGKVHFHKDGYTDLRGRFDYASLNADPLSGCKRLARYIDADGAGASVQQVSPP